MTIVLLNVKNQGNVTAALRRTFLVRLTLFIIFRQHRLPSPFHPLPSPSTLFLPPGSTLPSLGWGTTSVVFAEILSFAKPCSEDAIDFLLFTYL